MHVLFIHAATESLGVQYLSASLKRSGHTVGLLFDPQIFQSFRVSISGWGGKSAVVLAELAVQERPDLVCFSLCSDYVGWALSVAAAIKKRIPVPVVVGGIHPTIAPEAMLAQPEVDFVCVGEGEKALVELADALSCGKSGFGIANVWLKEAGKIQRTPLRPLDQDLDALPFPDKELFFQCFPGFVTGSYHIMTSRGCVHGCAYCHNSALRKVFSGQGAYVRRRSVNNVMLELEQGLRRYNFQRVSFCDDLFTVDKAWLKEFATVYKKNINRPYFCSVHPLFADEERVSLLVESGCSVVNMGIQTINDDHRGFLLRKERDADVVRALEVLGKTRIFVYTNFIFGLPKQNQEDLEAIALFCNEHRADFHDVNWLRYYPKTQILETAQQEGVLCEKDVHVLDQGLEFKPYAHGGHGFSRVASKIRNLIFLSHFLPQGWVRHIVQKKWYLLLPAGNCRSLLIMLRVLSQRGFSGKQYPYPNFSLRDMWKYYMKFFWNKPVAFSGSPKGVV